MDDTIVAIATALTAQAISIIRVSGSEAIFNVAKIFTNKNLLNTPSHTILYGHIKDNDEVIDEVLVNVMRSPKTYTKEDTVEINCHGGIKTTQKVLELLLKNGCRMAEAGEFTKRAFLNGRISLLEAEAVNDLINATTDAARSLAINNVDGLLTKKIRNLRDKMAKILANIEVNIDYPEYEDEVEVTHELMEDYLKDITINLKNIVNGSQNGRIIKNGLNVAIVGSPNVGKSSILNYLLDEEKAIVTDIPGTTRDIVEGSMTLNGIMLNFIDTAGIRETNDIVEQIGVNKSKKILKEADLILLVLNYNELIKEEEKELIKSIDKNKLIIVINKNDLELKINLDELKDYDYVLGNTIDLDGLDKLKEKIIDKYNLGDIIYNDMAYLTNVRQIDLINKALEEINNANKAYLENMPIDIIEINIKEAWNILGELIGDAYTDELVDNIFSNFCLGK